MKHIVGFSGGIDSQACARWVLNRFPAEDVILMNSDAGGNEHPLTVAFVDDYHRTIHPVMRVTAIHADIWETEHYAERRGFDSNAPLDFPTMMTIKKGTIYLTPSCI
jgi:3'-phosphoadenosine 5'-phosphosulfate sulfotransferase (PAPS reductase)/FAD synthetase